MKTTLLTLILLASATRTLAQVGETVPPVGVTTVFDGNERRPGWTQQSEFCKARSTAAISGEANGIS